MSRGIAVRLFWVLGLLAVALGASWVYARFEVQDRFALLANRVRDVGPRRGLDSKPTEKGVRAQVEAMAEELGVRVRALEVTVRPLEGSERADPASERMRNALAQAQERAGAEGSKKEQGRKAGNKQERPFEELRRPDAAMKLAATVIEVHAKVEGRKWFWQFDDDIDIRRVMRRRIERAR